MTVHFGDVLHAAPPPRAPGRSGGDVRDIHASRDVAYVGPGNGYNDVLFAHDGQVHSPDEIRAGA